MSTHLRNSDVFINCPFDPGYRPIFDAIVFSVSDLGFAPRCSLEEDDAGESRLSKIERIIEECQFGINDLSAVALDVITGLPRFNMPLELGLFLGCKRFGLPHQSKKRTMILDRDLYRYRSFISDISGQDIRAHGGDPDRAIREVRDWLRTPCSGAKFLSALIGVHRRLNFGSFEKTTGRRSTRMNADTNPANAPSSASSSSNTLPSIHAAQ